METSGLTTRAKMPVWIGSYTCPQPTQERRGEAVGTKQHFSRTQNPERELNFLYNDASPQGKALYKN